ncbi:tetratricopeptide repeat protein [Methyloferula stellata]|uniref:tetratricopeptide repeat protein n=1 Tax=Methyloferula stellata TaxID=876270 RepID=UPI001FCB6204|nr:tetratricopeptide repeat protein [Methyloferula stellata]
MSACLMAGGCQNTSLSDVTGSISVPQNRPMPTSEPELRRYTEDLGRRYDANPESKNTAIAYAKGLRALTQYAQAVAVMQRLAAKYPKDLEVLGAYGKALADAGRLQEAANVLSHAHTPEQPNWSILSAQGSVADQLGDHAQAQNYYEAALKIAPDQPEVLSNLGLSYALSKHLPQAETTLEKAVAQPNADMRVRQNLALVLALQGKFNEAQTIAARDLSPVDAATNVESIKEMIAQSNTWQQIQKVDGKTKTIPKAQASADIN